MYFNGRRIWNEGTVFVIWERAEKKAIKRY